LPNPIQSQCSIHCKSRKIAKPHPITMFHSLQESQDCQTPSNHNVRQLTVLNAFPTISCIVFKLKRIVRTLIQQCVTSNSHQLSFSFDRGLIINASLILCSVLCFRVVSTVNWQ
jgi:hypothetical protein